VFIANTETTNLNDARYRGKMQ